MLIFTQSGQDDENVPIEWGTKTASSLVLRGVEIKFSEYTETGHEISEEQVIFVIHLHSLPLLHQLPFDDGYVASYTHYWTGWRTF
jgi:predicted esterase